MVTRRSVSEIARSTIAGFVSASSSLVADVHALRGVVPHEIVFGAVVVERAQGRGQAGQLEGGTPALSSPSRRRLQVLAAHVVQPPAAELAADVALEAPVELPRRLAAEGATVAVARGACIHSLRGIRRSCRLPAVPAWWGCRARRWTTSGFDSYAIAAAFG